MSNSLRIERDHLVQVTVTFNFLLVLLDGIEQVFQQVALTASFFNRRSWASGDARREIDQCSKLSDLSIACSKSRQCELFVLERINGRS
ncbi:hypothetical protein ADM96_03020 [Burkholderia sp. ST111]|nr:hypothetical protein ADM96_03020 [Burkholderia sp. ST111]MBK3782634.1 hypothetical protein [Paraburkholderia aspalathi]